MQNNSNIKAIEIQIASEVRCNSQGEATYTVRAAARLVGISPGGLSDNLSSGVQLAPSKMGEYLIGKGFNGDQLREWAASGIPDVGVGAIATYYAFHAGRYCNEQSRALCEALIGDGIRKYSQKIAGWKPYGEKPTSVENYKAALMAVLEEQVPSKPTAWQCRYKKDFWEALEDLYGLQKGQWSCGNFISTYIYGYFPEEVQSRLEAINPILDNGNRANRHHQHFEDTLLNLLQSHISNVTFLLQASQDKKSFKKAMKKIKKFKFNEMHLNQLAGANNA